MRQVELPEAGGWSAGAVENGKVVESDGDGVGGEGGNAAVVAKCASGDEGAEGEGGKGVWCLTGLRRKRCG